MVLFQITAIYLNGEPLNNLFKTFYHKFALVKKLIAILFLTAYGLNSFGATIDLHFCGGKLSGISVIKAYKQPDCCAKLQMPKDCCKDVQIKLKQISDQHMLFTDAQFKDNTFYVTPHISLDNFSEVHYPVLITPYTSINAPPLIHNVRLYLLNGIFLI